MMRQFRAINAPNFPSGCIPKTACYPFLFSLPIPARAASKRQNLSSRANHLPTKSNLLPIGKLEELQLLKTQFKQARGLPGNLPVLSCPISEEQKHLLGSQGGRSNLGFGCINLGDGSKLQTIRFQMGGLQFYWVADMVDPEVWAAIDMWRTVGRMPLLFRIENGKDWDAKFGVIGGPTGSLRNEAFRSDVDSVSTASTVAELPVSSISISTGWFNESMACPRASRCIRCLAPDNKGGRDRELAGNPHPSWRIMTQWASRTPLRGQYRSANAA